MEGQKLLRLLKDRMIDEIRLRPAARKQRKADRGGVLYDDPGISAAIDVSMQWLCRAQDSSASMDGGVARDYSLNDGWATSYPETTGYIVPTFLALAGKSGDEQLQERSRRMLDWLVEIQLPGGGIQGGKVDSAPVVPVTFNTGQVLLGFSSGARYWTDYLEPMTLAADWLVDTIDDDGCWRKFPSPFVSDGDKAYDTHVAWGLLEAARVAGNEKYATAALANIEWALGHQYDNGWVDKCCLSDPEQPLTHTLGYFLRGVIEGYRYSSRSDLLDRAKLTADGLLQVQLESGALPGQLDSSWTATVHWYCLTGIVQIAECWLMLYEYTSEKKYLSAGCLANQFVRRTIKMSGNPDLVGAVKGSYPVDGDYGRFQYLNWAAKFFIDSNIREKDISRNKSSAE